MNEERLVHCNVRRKERRAGAIGHQKWSEEWFHRMGSGGGHGNTWRRPDMARTLWVNGIAGEEKIQRNSLRHGAGWTSKEGQMESSRRECFFYIDSGSFPIFWLCTQTGEQEKIHT